MDFFEKAMKEMQPIYALADFLKVKAPDHIEKEAFYYNENGEGFLETFYKANPEPVKHEVEGKLFYTNENGETFNVVRKDDFVLENQTRKAKTKKDFQEIYNREFEAKDLEDTPENHNLFTIELFNQVEHLISIHKESTNFEKRDLKTISRANVFLSFLKHPLTESNKNPEESTEHPQHNPNLWNKECFELFKYLYDNYYNSQVKRQLTNIWFYLKEYDPLNYTLKATKDQYKDFILDNYGVELKNTVKAQVKYETKEFPTMNDHRIQFEENFLKQP